MCALNKDAFTQPFRSEETTKFTERTNGTVETRYGVIPRRASFCAISFLGFGRPLRRIAERGARPYV